MKRDELGERSSKDEEIKKQLKEIEKSVNVLKWLGVGGAALLLSLGGVKAINALESWVQQASNTIISWAEQETPRTEAHLVSSTGETIPAALSEVYPRIRISEGNGAGASDEFNVYQREAVVGDNYEVDPFIVMAISDFEQFMAKMGQGGNYNIGFKLIDGEGQVALTILSSPSDVKYYTNAFAWLKNSGTATITQLESMSKEDIGRLLQSFKNDTELRKLGDTYYTVNQNHESTISRALAQDGRNVESKKAQIVGGIGLGGLGIAGTLAAVSVAAWKKHKQK